MTRRAKILLGLLALLVLFGVCLWLYLRLKPKLEWAIIFDGYGNVEIQNGELTLYPAIASASSETHAALVTAGNPNWTEYTLTTKIRTITQLRRNDSPNPWEVGWIFFRYTDLNNFYYFILKPNGVELGKRQGGSTQIFLFTNNTPTSILGQWHKIKIVLRDKIGSGGGLNTNIKIYVDGRQAIDYTDSTPLKRGQIGVYCEDSHVLFDDVVVRLSVR